MKKKWSQIESQWVMDKLCETHYEESVNLYQKIGHPHILIAEVSNISYTELEHLKEMNISISIFAESYRIELWMIKL